MTNIAPLVQMFDPAHWGQLDRFEKFWPTTYPLNERGKRALSGVRAHLEKAMRLQALGARLRPNLQRDVEQLNARGFTAADEAKELVTVIEAAILEIYSCVDCTVKVLRAIYEPGTRGFKESTRTTFAGVHKFVGTFPDSLKIVISAANDNWYRPLLHLRDELTHLDTGDVYLEPDMVTVRYSHFGMKQNQKPLIIPDIFQWLANMLLQVNGFLGVVFKHLNDALKDEPVFQICGMINGRLLHRYIRPEAHLTFNSGSCGSWVWFDLPENPSCPFRDRCGAYLNKSPAPAT